MYTSQTKQSIHYRIKLTIAVYKEKKLIYRNDMLVPTSYKRRSECRAHIRKETQHRLRNSNFFLSPRMDFDLVRYTQEASSNTYLRYRIIEEREEMSSKKIDAKKERFGLQKQKSSALTSSSDSSTEQEQEQGLGLKN